MNTEEIFKAQFRYSHTFDCFLLKAQLKRDVFFFVCMRSAAEVLGST